MRDRLRNLRRGPVSSDPIELVHGRADSTRERDHIPGPIGAEYPHRLGSLSYDDDHPLWNDYERAVRAAAAEAGEDATRADVLAILTRHPQFTAWQQAESHGVRAYRDREKLRAGKATFSTQRETRRRRIEFEQAGGDTTSAEYLDMLTPSGRAAALRRQGRVAEARSIERDMRHRRKHGPRRHAA